MNDVPILGGDDPEQVLKQVESMYDAPAYVRRARRVQQVFDALVERCRRQRHEWLGMVRIRLGTLHALAGGWAALRPLVAGDDDLRALAAMHDDLQPQLRAPVEPTSSRRALRQALHELSESLERFNRRWRAFLDEIDLSGVNREREGYNRYYVLEQECAVRSLSAARHGFQPLEPLTREEFEALLPPLPVPRPAES
jgi:hypothetical protein